MIYTFYSYKGGVGRSMALANIAEYFYRKGLRVAIVDWDLEAPGLETFYFDPQSDAGKTQLRRVRSHLGLMDMLLTYKDQYSSLKFPSDEIESKRLKTNTAEALLDNAAENAAGIDSVEAAAGQDVSSRRTGPVAGNGDAGAVDKEAQRSDEGINADVAYLKSSLLPLDSYLFEIHGEGSLKSDPRAALKLLSAGWREGERFSSYSWMVQTFNWSDFYIRYKGKVFFEWLRAELEQISDVILIDSRTGVTEMGSVCTRQLPDVVVSCSVLNSQNMEGVAKMMKSFKREEVLDARDGRPLETIVVPTRIDTQEIDTRATLIGTFEQIMGEVPIEFEQANTNYWKMGIPYVGKYAYFERLAIGSSDRAYELQNAYKALATHLALLAPKDSLLRTKLADDLKQVLRVTESLVPMMAPALPSAFVERPVEIARLKQSLCPPTEGAPKEPIVLYGPPGSGKSTIAAAFAREGDVVEAFKDGILWVTLGAHPNIIEALAGLYAKITGDARTFVTEDEASRHLSTKLVDKVCLLVIDDLCDVSHLRPFINLGNQCSFLITTRDPRLVSRTAAKPIQVERLSAEQALELVGRVSKFPSTHPEELHEFVSRLPMRPLALKLAGDVLRQRIEFVGDEPLSALAYATHIRNEKGVTAFDKMDTADRNQSIAKSIAASLEFLSPVALERYVQLALVLDHQQLSVAEVSRLWSGNGDELNADSQELDVEERLQYLHALSLVQYDAKSKTVQLDAAIRNNLLAELPSEVGLHLRAESVFTKFSPEQQVTAKNVLTRLVRVGRPGGIEGDTRSRVSLRNLDDPSKSIVKTLVDGKILIQEEDPLTRERKVQFTDESLINKWSRLREWIDQDRKFLLWLQQIRPSLNAWNSGDRHALLTGEDLTTAKIWLSSRPDLDPSVRSYVTLSDETHRRQLLWKVLRALILTLVILVVGGLMIWKEVTDKRAQDALRQRQQQAVLKQSEAEAAVQRQDYDKAIQLYSEALPDSTNRGAVYYGRGNAFSSKGNQAQAISDFNNAIQLDPSGYYLYLARGVAFLKAGDKGNALQDFNLVAASTTDPQLKTTADAFIKDLSGKGNAPTPTPSPTPTPVPPIIYLQFRDEQDRDQINFIQAALQKRGYNVISVQMVTQDFKPQVKYYFDEDQSNANAIRSVVMNSLKQLNFPVNLRLGKVIKPGNAPRGTVEVWLSSLSGP